VDVTAQATKRRDYSLLGPESARAVAAGLASATWYKSPVPRKRMKELMQRSDARATRDTALWFAIIVGFGIAGVLTWRSWWSLPIFFVYGTFYGSTSDSRWHETGHGTAFKTPWKNNVVYQIACFMLWREPEPRRWSHTRHHTDTIIVGRDPEIITPRPPKLFHVLLDVFALVSGPKEMVGVFRHAFGNVSAEEREYIPASEIPKIARTARIWLVIFAVVIAVAVLTRSILPILLIGGPKIYGAWFQLFTGLMQHIALADDVLDHRLNSRTVYMNPVFRFMYWNMNYHLEHHQNPMVPFHQLPALHQEIIADSPTPYSGCIEAYREIIPSLLRQVREPDFWVHRTLPTPAAVSAD
jgi:fatty acid desaturase